MIIEVKMKSKTCIFIIEMQRKVADNETLLRRIQFKLYSSLLNQTIKAVLPRKQGHKCDDDFFLALPVNTIVIVGAVSTLLPQ